MDNLLESIRHQPLIFVGGKGGVGKTTHAASLAIRLSALGRKVLVISTDPAHSLGDVLNQPLSAQIQVLTPYLSALEINPQEMMDQHFAQVNETLKQYARPEMLSALKRHLDASKSSPGAEEAALLEAICRYIVQAKEMGFDHLVFDTAPTGHTLRLLELPQMMQAWTDSLLAQQGRQQQLREAALPFWQKSTQKPSLLSEAKNARWEKALSILKQRQALFAQAGHYLSDPLYTSIVLVMTPEMLPLAETRRAVAQLQVFGLPCQHLIINQLLPTPEPEQFFWEQRYQRQQGIVEQIEDDFSGLNRHYFALQAHDVRGIEALKTFGETAQMKKAVWQASETTLFHSKRKHQLGCLCCVDDEKTS